MPSLLLTDDDLDTLPTSGTAWNRLVTKANTDPGTPNLGNLDQPEPAACLSVALRYAKDGGGLGRARCVTFLKAAMGTESGAGQPLNPERTIGTIFQIADLIDNVPSDPVGAMVGKNGQTFNAWAQSLPHKTLPGQANWNSLWKCSDISGNNWGACSRASLLAVCMWLIKKGLNPTGSYPGAPTTATGMRDAVIQRFKRWCGDLSVPNTFVPTGAVQASFCVASYPGSQGAINPVTSLVRSGVVLDGCQVEDAGRSTFPDTGGAGEHYQYESLESSLVTIIMLVNAGYTDAKTYGSNGVRRNYKYMMNNNRTTPSADYHDFFSMQWPVVNWLWNLGFPSRTITGAQRRLLTTHTDWLTSSGSSWLDGTGSSGGGGTAIEPPIASFALPATAASGATVTLNASASTAGSAAIARYKITWGDGSAQQTLTAPTSSATHVYTTTTAVRRTVTLLVEAADGGTDTATKTIDIAGADGAPVARFTITDSIGNTLTQGVAPLTVYYHFDGSFDPNGDPMSGDIDWGDGTTTHLTSVPVGGAISGQHTFADVADTLSRTIAATVTANSKTSASVIRTVTLSPASVGSNYTLDYVVFDGRKVPEIDAYDGTWDGVHPILGAYHLWFDTTGALRYKAGKPTGPQDGAPVGGSSTSGTAGGVAALNADTGVVPAGTPAGTLFVLYR